MKFMRFTVLLLISLTCTAGNAQRLEKNKIIRLKFFEVENSVRYYAGDYNFQFNYNDFFDASAPEKIKNAYELHRTTVQRYYAVLNDFNAGLNGKDSMECSYFIRKKIFTLIDGGKVIITRNKGSTRVKKLNVYIDKEVPPAAAIRWVYFDGKEGKEIFQFDEVSIGCPTF